MILLHPFLQYDPYKTPMENIGLQDSLLSRFDLLFVMLDTVDEDTDSKIADHVVRMHRYRNPKEKDGEILPMGSGVDLPCTYNPDTIDEDRETPIYEKYDPLLHGSTRTRHDNILSVEFMRKYIHFVKIMKPVLTEEASEVIAEEYSRLRSEELMDSDVARTQPVTARTLETMIRLATAHAKARMARKVTLEDAQAALELIHYAYFKKVLEKTKRTKRRRNSQQSEESADEGTTSKSKTKKSRRSKTQASTNGDDPYDYQSDDDEQVASQRSTRSRRVEDLDAGTNETAPSTNGTNGHAPVETQEEMEVEELSAISDDR